MNLTIYKSCQKSLDFKPDRSWPKFWPSVSYENKLISGFTNIYQPVLNFKKEDVNFLHLFQHCHPRLNLSELGRIVISWSQIEPPPCSWTPFFKLYGLNQNTDFLIQQLKMFISTPFTFQNWVNTKEVHLNELRVLNSVEEIQPLYFILNWIAEHNLSHSNGIKALELSVELWLMGHTLEKILKTNLSPEKALLEMEHRRKPLSSSQDQIKKKQVQKIIWPSDMKAQWVRKGDKTGLQIQMWCRNLKDLDKKQNR